MKQSDIRRLEKVATLYDNIVELLDKTYDSIEKDDYEFITLGHTEITTLELVRGMLNDARNEKVWIRGKISIFKEIKQ